MEEAQSLSVSLGSELDVTDLNTSLAFYVGLIGFEVVFEQPRGRFVYLALGPAEPMLQDAEGPGRRFRTAPLAHPFGRGINLQIAVPDVDCTYHAAVDAGLRPVLAPIPRGAPSASWARALVGSRHTRAVQKGTGIA